MFADQKWIGWMLLTASILGALWVVAYHWWAALLYGWSLIACCELRLPITRKRVVISRLCFGVQL